MGSRQGGNPPRTPYDELYLMAGTLYGGGTAPTARLIRGGTMKRGGTGTYVFIPDVNIPYIGSAGCDVVSATNLGYQASVTSYYAGQQPTDTGHTAGSTCFVTYQVNVGGIGITGGAAVDLVAGEELHFQVWAVRSMRP